MQIYNIIKILRRNKKMAVNKVDYEVLTSGVSVYSNQAGAQIGRASCRERV